MIFVPTWPGSLDLNLPPTVKQLLMEELTKPFANEPEAINYWNDYSGTLIILEAEDDLALLNKLTSQAREQIEFALAYPEFRDPIGNDHFLSLTIISDEGTGIYLLTHKQCPLLKEIGNA